MSGISRFGRFILKERKILNILDQCLQQNDMTVLHFRVLALLEGMTACGTLDYLAPEAFCSSTSRQAMQNQLIYVDTVDGMMVPFGRIAVDFFS